MLSRVRVDAANADSRIFVPGARERVVRADDCPLHQAGFDFGDSVDQADMRSDVNDLEPWGGKHHRHLRCTGQVREHLGVSRETMATGMKRFLVQGRGTDCVDLAGGSKLHCPSKVLVGGIAADSGEFSPREASRDELEINAIHSARRELCLGGILNRIDLQLIVDDSPGFGQSGGIADDQRMTAFVQVRVIQAFHNDLRADAGSVAHRDPNRG